MEEDYKFKLLLEFPDTKIPSVNSIYLPKRGGGMYLAPEAVKFRNLVTKQVNEMLMKDETIQPKINSIPLYHLHIEYIMKSGVNSRDLDNLNKLAQDSIFKTLGINDARVVSLNIEKYSRQGGNYEFMIVELSPSKIDILKWQ